MDFITNYCFVQFDLTTVTTCRKFDEKGHTCITRYDILNNFTVIILPLHRLQLLCKLFLISKPFY